MIMPQFHCVQHFVLLWYSKVFIFVYRLTLAASSTPLSSWQQIATFSVQYQKVFKNVLINKH